MKNCVLTNNGRALLAKLTAGTNLNITRAVTGTGSVNTALLRDQTSVTGAKQEMAFRAYSYPEQGQCKLPCRIDNVGLAAGYTVTQIGIYANDPDAGEILFIILQADNGKGTDVPSETESPGFMAEWNVTLSYGQADGVTVIVDPSNTVSFAEMEAQVNKHASNKNNPHGVTAKQAGALPIAGGTMMGDLFLTGKWGCAWANTSETALSHYKDNTDTANQKRLRVTDAFSLARALSLIVRTNGVESEYLVYGEHNKPVPNAIGAAEASSHNIKTYTNLSQLGLSDGVTMSQVARALPGGSVLRIYVLTSANQNLAPVATNGWLEVHRPSVNHVIFRYTTSSLKQFVAHVLSVGAEGESVSVWSRIMQQSDIAAGTADLTAGSTALETGNYYFVYE